MTSSAIALLLQVAGPVPGHGCQRCRRLWGVGMTPSAIAPPCRLPGLFMPLLTGGALVLWSQHSVRADAFTLPLTIPTLRGQRAQSYQPSLRSQRAQTKEPGSLGNSFLLSQSSVASAARMDWAGPPRLGSSPPRGACSFGSGPGEPSGRPLLGVAVSHG